MRRLARLGLYTLAALFAFEWRTPLITLGPIGFTTTECLIAVVIIVWGASFINEGRLPRRPTSRVWAPLLLWVGIMAISTVAAPVARWNAGLFLARVGAGIGIGWAAYDLLDNPAHIRNLLGGLVVGGGLVAITGLAEATQHPAVLNLLSGFKAAPTRVGDLLRVSGVLSYATIMAVVLEVILLTSVAVFFSSKRRFTRIMLGGSLLLMMAALLLTLSRAGVVASLAGLFFYGVMGVRYHNRRIAWNAAGMAGLLVMGVVTLFAINPTVLLRLQSETEQGWYQVNKNAPAEAVARPGEQIMLPVTVYNTGLRAWQPDEGFMLGYHLTDASGEVITYDGARTLLPAPINPGDSTELEAIFIAPSIPGTYTAEWDMVHEGVTWFSWEEAPTAETRIRVAGAPVTDAVPVQAVPAPVDRLNTAQTPGRLDLWQAAWAMFIDRPILGVGPDNFRYRYGDYAGLETWNEAIHANNLYLELLADTGVMGFGAFMWFSGALGMVIGNALLRDQEVAGGLLLVGCGAALLAWYVHGLVDFFYAFTPTYTLFWLVAAAALSLAEGENDAHRI